MADRYPMAPNFTPGMMSQQHHPIQQQQQQPQDNHHPMVGFNDQNWMQQQMRPQNQMDLFRARQQQQQQQQQFMQQSFMDNQNQPHMPMGFNMGIQQSMHNRNNMLQTLQNSRQLELIGMAQNQQNQNGPIRPSTDLFSSPAINGEAMRRPSPAHPNQPPPQPSNQPMRQISRPEIQERVQQMRTLIAQVDNAMHQLQNSRAGMNDAVFVTKMRQFQTEKNNRVEALQRMLTVFNNINMPLPNGQYMQTPFSASQPNNPPQPPSLPVHNAPPRTGPTPQQPNTSFHGQMGNPNFGLNPMNPQNPASGSGPGTMPNSAPPALPVFSVSPLEKGRFDQSFKVWCQQKSVLIDPRLLNIDGRPIDLYSLHSHVIREGGLGNVQAKDLWAVIGARMGFVQFPGTSNEPPKSGPVIAQNLAHVYKEYLAAFDAVYIASLENKRKQLGVNARPNATPPGGSLAGFPPKNWTPHQLRVILSSADKSREALAAQGFPENAITFIETHRAQLQQMVTDQSAFRDIIRPNQNPSIDGNRPMPFPLPATTSQPQSGNPNQGQFPLQPNGQPSSGPPRFNRELISNAHISIARMKAEITQRISAAPNVDVPAEQRVEYNDLLERANRQATEFEAKLNVFFAMTRNEETVKKLVHNIVLVQQQRTMLSWSNPRFILGMDMLRQSLAHITHAAEQLSLAVSNMMKAQPQGPNSSNNNTNTNNSGPRPPVQIPPPPQQHSSPPPPLAPSLSRPLNIQQPPKKKPPTAGPSPTVAPAPTPPPAVAATTPVASAATPTNSNAAASPQTPKSPKTKVKSKPTPKPRRPSVKGNQAATPSSSAPTEPPAPAPVAGVKRPHEGDVSSPNNNAPTPAGPSLVASEPSPPKRVKTEWDGEVSESLKKKNEAVENIRTDEDANQFFEQTLSELMKMSGDDGQASLTSDISDTLDMILKNYGGVPESGGASGDLDGSTSAPPGSSDDFGQYFDFSSFTHDDDEDSKTPDLISSSSANPSPESDTDSVHPHHGPIADIKQEDFDPLRLGTLKEIDGGESAYYQSSEWKWDGAMPNNEQPWAIFNS